MAKGDSGEMQNLINTQGAKAQGVLSQAQNQTQGQYGNMMGNYNQGVNMNLPDYSNVMSGYQQFLSGQNPTGNMGLSGGGQLPFMNSPNMGSPGRISPYGGSQSSYQPPIITPESQPYLLTQQQNRLQNQGGMQSPGYAGVQGNPYSGQNSGLSGNYAGASQTGPASSGIPLTGDPKKDAIIKVFNQYGKSDTGPGSGDTDLGYWENQGLNNAQGDAGYIAGRVNSAFSGQGGQGGGSDNSPGSAISGFQNFAETGGLSPQQIQDLRARAIAPTRAIYQNAQNDLATQKNLSGGYMPNYAAAQADLARKSNYGINDANVNANASIAQMIQQGKLSGLQGLTGAQLGALGGMTGMYGANPGLSSVFGNQVLGSNTQNLEGAQLQNALMQALFSGKLGQSQIPGNFQQAMGNIGSIFGLGGNIASGLSGLGGLFGGGNSGLSGLPGGMPGPF